MNLNQLFESPQQCPECGGISFSDLILAEKKDACYYKVKAGAKVWPSAYASGRLVQCRKKGAANYGNKSESVAESELDEAVGMIIKGAAISGPDDQDIADRIAAKTGGRVDSGSYGHHILITYPTPQDRAAAAVKIRKMFPGIELYKSGGNRNAIDEQGVAEGMWDQHQSIPELEQAIENLIMGYKGGLNLTDKGRAQLLLSINKGKRILAKKKQQQDMAEDQLDEKWSQKYKNSINCANPKGFSQKAHCAGRNKNESIAEGMKADELSRYCEELVAEKGWDAAYKHAKFMAAGATDPAWGSVLKYLDAMKDGVSEAKKQPPEAKYDDEYDAMVARVKKLAGLGPMKTVYDPTKRVYKNIPTAQQPKK